MLRAGIRDPDRPVVIVGLSDGNIERLKAGFPIKAELRTFVPELAGELVILHGKTEQDLEAMLREGRLIGPDTIQSADPGLDQEAAASSEHKRILIATVGLPRAGKSAWAKSQAYPTVSIDAIRLALYGQRYQSLTEPFVWAIAKCMVRALFGAGHRRVILDATNTTRRRRDEWQVPEEWGTFFKVFDTPKELCLSRAANDPDIRSTIERMAEMAEPLAPGEARW